MRANESKNVTGLATGFIDLDYRTGGLQPSDLILLAARPSMGKTALALSIARNIAGTGKQCVAIFTLEMSKRQLVNRLLALDSATNISSSKLIIDDTPALTVSEMRNKCWEFKKKHDLRLVVVDYLQLMGIEGNEKTQKEKVSEIARELKALAREMNVPIVVLSQLNKEIEKREDKRPTFSDLNDLGTIGQDADVVMFIYRDDYYNLDSPDKGLSEIIIAKQHNGSVGTINLAWVPEYARFENMEIAS